MSEEKILSFKYGNDDGTGGIFANYKGSDISSNYHPDKFGYINVVNNGENQAEYSWVPPEGVHKADVLVVAGGGGGGTGGSGAHEAGGGGAGGLLFLSTQNINGQTNINVGRGGNDNQNGSNSVFNDSEAIGGGAGGGAGGSDPGNDGGSGGGGANNTTPGGSGVSGQGHVGGQAGSPSTGGGGGGAGEPGNTRGEYEGGDGLDFSNVYGKSWGVNGYFAGGGYGVDRSTSSARGGLGGGGGRGTNLSIDVGKPDDGLPHTGGGGAGSWSSKSSVRGGLGGSGIVIIRFYLPPPPPTRILAFKYGGDDGTGGIFADMSSGQIEKSYPSAFFGSISVVTNGANQTEYSWTPPGGGKADVLVVAGGGSGGTGGTANGGGGAGGVLLVRSNNLDSSSYLVVVGKGGNRPPIQNVQGNDGSNSSFGSITAIGGGGGGTHKAAELSKGRDGGSGGGAGTDYDPRSGGLNTLGQGFPGGVNKTTSTSGGGGGAGQKGGNGTSTNGYGGDGLYMGDIFTNNVGDNGYFGGGGGGGGTNGSGSGGLGGGGAGAVNGTSAGFDAVPHTGGGGGGNRSGSGLPAGSGGSGIVIIRFDFAGTHTLSGLVGHYTAESVDVETTGKVTRWRDLSGRGNHVEASNISGKVFKSDVTRFFDDFTIDTSAYYLIQTFNDNGPGPRWIWDTQNKRLQSDDSNSHVSLRVDPVFLPDHIPYLDLKVEYLGTADNDGVGLMILDKNGNTWYAIITLNSPGNSGIAQNNALNFVVTGVNIDVTVPHELRLKYENGLLTFFVDGIEHTSYQTTIDIETFGIASIANSPPSLWDSIEAEFVPSSVQPTVSNATLEDSHILAFHYGLDDSIGTVFENPAANIQHILKANPMAKSGYYYIRPSESANTIRVFCDVDGSASGIGSGRWYRIQYAQDYYSREAPWKGVGSDAYSGEFSFDLSDADISSLLSITTETRQQFESFGYGSVGWTYALPNNPYMGGHTFNNDPIFYLGDTKPSTLSYNFNGIGGPFDNSGTDPTDANDTVWRRSVIYFHESGSRGLLPVKGIQHNDVDSSHEQRYFPLLSGEKSYVWMKDDDHASFPTYNPTFAATGGKFFGDSIASYTSQSTGTVKVINNGPDQVEYEWTPPPALPNMSGWFADVLVVAGGGGGAHGGGGGGAGGIILERVYLTNGSKKIMIGRGGAGTNRKQGNGINGSDTIFDNIWAVGGGGGGARDIDNNYRRRNGNSGGSGGGGSSGSTPSSLGFGGLGINGQGNNGGDETMLDAYYNAGGGGAGKKGSNTPGGDGGDGLYFGDLFGKWVGVSGYFGGGGGGAGPTTLRADTRPGIGGLGGGGKGGGQDGSVNDQESGLMHTGGGGGGARDASSALGGNGGSGIVIIRLKSVGKSVTSFPYVYGSTADGIVFPAALTAQQDYTLFHVARYFNPNVSNPSDVARDRIMSGLTTDWASGFDAGKSGVARRAGKTEALKEFPPWNGNLITPIRTSWTKDLNDTVTGLNGETYARYKFKAVGSGYGDGEYVTWANSIYGYSHSTSHGSEWSPAGAFDKILGGNGFHDSNAYTIPWSTTSDLTNPVELYIRLPLSISLNKYTITNRRADQAPQKWELYGSDDEVIWTFIKLESGQIDWLADETRTFYLFDNDQQFRTYRWDFLRNNGSADLSFYEIKLFADDIKGKRVIESPQFTSSTTVADDYNTRFGWNTDQGWEVSASSVFSSSYEGWKGLNKITGNNGDIWHSNVADVSPQWLRIKFPQPVSLISYSITIRDITTTSTWFPNKWHVQGSNDDVTWYNLEPSQIMTSWNTGETKTFSGNLSNTRFSIFRLYIENAQKNSSDPSDNRYVAIGNWSLFVEEEESQADDWVLSSDQYSHTSQEAIYRSNGNIRDVISGTAAECVPDQLTINNGTGTKSDWAVAELMMYDRKLSTQEIQAVESYLKGKYFDSTQATMPTIGSISASSIMSFIFSGSQKSKSKGGGISLAQLLQEFTGRPYGKGVSVRAIRGGRKDVFAQGGDEEYDYTAIDGNTYHVHVFKQSGKFTINKSGLAKVLIVGGGGGGASGGGGAGELVFTTGKLVPGTINVTVGDGGLGGRGGASTFDSFNGLFRDGEAQRGQDSHFGNIVAEGGGAGAGRNLSTYIDGGSGGGQSFDIFDGPGIATADKGFGNIGGAAIRDGYGGAGGGGGAGGKGLDATNYSSTIGLGGEGGMGINMGAKFGTAVGDKGWFAGGGGGGINRNNDDTIIVLQGGQGGIGGGGQGGRTDWRYIKDNYLLPVKGMANTGGGGGGGDTEQSGADGGSGVVLVQYPRHFTIANRSRGALDDDEVKPVAAYSIRLLYGDYLGPILRVRRSTDNMEADVYFDDLGQVTQVDVINEKKETVGDLDTWLNGATGFVNIWYDQSGLGKDARTLANENQPEIFKSGDEYSIKFSNTAPQYFKLPDATIPYGSDGDTSYSVFIDFQNATGRTLISSGLDEANKGNHFEIRVGSVNRFANFWYSNDNNVDSSVLSPTTNMWWTTYDANPDRQQVKMYFKQSGENVALTATATPPRLNPPTDQYIGYEVRYTSGSTYGLNGELKNILIHDVALTQDQIQTSLKGLTNRERGALDYMDNKPVAALALRHLFADYTGPQIRVKRATDNVEADVYFDNAGKIIRGEEVLSETIFFDLDTWLDGGMALVVSWFDQSGKSFDAVAMASSYTLSEYAPPYLVKVDDTYWLKHYTNPTTPDTNTRRFLQIKSPGAYAVCTDPNGYIYVGIENEVHKVDPANMGNTLGVFKGHTDRVTALVYGTDGSIYSGGADNKIYQILPSHMSVRGVYTGHNGDITSLVWGDDGFLYSGSHDQSVQRININVFNTIDTYSLNTSNIPGIALGQDENYVYSVNRDGEIHKIYIQEDKTFIQDAINTSIAKQYKTMLSQTFIVNDEEFICAYDQDNDLLFKIRTSDLTLSQTISPNFGANCNYMTLAPASDGKNYIYATSYNNGKLIKVDPEDFIISKSVTHDSTAVGVAMGQNFKLYVCGNKRLRKVDADTLDLVETYSGEGSSRGSMETIVWHVVIAVIDDIEYAFVSCGDFVHKVRTSDMLFEAEFATSGRIIPLVYGKDKYLYSCDSDGNFHKINPYTMEEIAILNVHNNICYSIIYTSSGFIISGSLDQTIKVTSVSLGLDTQFSSTTDATNAHAAPVTSIAYGTETDTETGTQVGILLSGDETGRIVKLSAADMTYKGDPFLTAPLGTASNGSQLVPKSLVFGGSYGFAGVSPLDDVGAGVGDHEVFRFNIEPTGVLATFANGDQISGANLIKVNGNDYVFVGGAGRILKLDTNMKIVSGVNEYNDFGGDLIYRIISGTDSNGKLWIFGNGHPHYIDKIDPETMERPSDNGRYTVGAKIYASTYHNENGKGYLYIGSHNSNLYKIDVDTMDVTQDAQGNNMIFSDSTTTHFEMVIIREFVDGQKYLFAGMGGGNIRKIDINTFDLLESSNINNATFTAIEYVLINGDPFLIATSWRTPNIYKINAITFELASGTNTYVDDTSNVATLTLNRVSNILYVGMFSGEMIKLDPDTMQIIGDRIQVHSTGPTRNIFFGFDGYVYTGAWNADEAAKVNLNDSRIGSSYTQHNSPLQQIAYLPDGTQRYIMSVDKQGELHKINFSFTLSDGTEIIDPQQENVYQIQNTTPLALTVQSNSSAPDFGSVYVSFRNNTVRRYTKDLAFISGDQYGTPVKHMNILDGDPRTFVIDFARDTNQAGSSELLGTNSGKMIDTGWYDPNYPSNKSESRLRIRNSDDAFSKKGTLPDRHIITMKSDSTFTKAWVDGRQIINANDGFGAWSCDNLDVTGTDHPDRYMRDRIRELLVFDDTNNTLQNEFRIENDPNQGALEGINVTGKKPIAAYALQSLFSDYNGPQVRISRSLDNVEADVYFDHRGELLLVKDISGTGNKNLDTWLGDSAAHISEWYDQSGNNNNATTTSIGFGGVPVLTKTSVLDRYVVSTMEVAQMQIPSMRVKSIAFQASMGKNNEFAHLITDNDDYSFRGRIWHENGNHEFSRFQNHRINGVLYYHSDEHAKYDNTRANRWWDENGADQNNLYVVSCDEGLETRQLPFDRLFSNDRFSADRAFQGWISSLLLWGDKVESQVGPYVHDVLMGTFPHPKYAVI